MADVKKAASLPKVAPSTRPALGPKAVPPHVTGARVPVPFGPLTQGPDARQQKEHEQAEAGLLAEGRLGDPSVSSAELRAMGSLVAGRHLMTLLARRRAQTERAEVIKEVGELLLGMDDGPWTRRLLLQMAEAGRIVDIYPLEVMAWLIEHHPGAVERLDFGPVILNKARLESEAHIVGGLIVLKVPLSLKMKSFGIEGGAAPGYIMAPGPPAHYLLEVHEPAQLTVLVRGDIRRTSLVDRVRLNVVPDPESNPNA